MRGHKWELRRVDRSPFWYVFAYIPGQGDKPVRRSTGRRERAAADIRAGEIWLAEMRKAGQPIEAGEVGGARVTIETAVDTCLKALALEAGEHREQYVRRHTEDLKLYILPKTDEMVAKGFWQPAWRYLDEITSKSWEKEKKRLHRKNGGPLKWRSIQHLTTTLNKMLQHCLDEGLLENVPKLKPPHNKLVVQEAAPRRAYTEAERERFLQAIKSRYPRSQRFYTVLFFSLMRVGELRELTPRWVDFKNGWIRVPAAHTKSGEVEEVDLHPRAARALKAELSEQETSGPDLPVFGHHDARKAFYYGLGAADIDAHGLVPHHSTRHTGATMVGESTTDLLAIMAAMRVRSPSIAKRYLHVDGKRGRGPMRKL